MDSRKALIGAAAVAALVGAGCGSNSGGGKSASATGASSASKTAAAGQQVKLQADGDGKLYFEQHKLKAKSGAVTIAMANPKTTGTHHGIAIEGNGVDKDGPIVAPGGTATLTVSLKPGTYTFYCPVPGHEKAGMKGTLVVSGGGGGSSASSGGASSGASSGGSGGGY